MRERESYRSLGAAVGLICALAMALAAVTACEIEPARDFSISVSPSSTRLMQGESVELVAAGGLNYTWSLQEGSTTQRWGILSAQSGDRVTYTSTRSERGNTNIQVVTVTSNLGDEDSSDSNAVVRQASAEAYIFHVPVVR